MQGEREADLIRAIEEGVVDDHPLSRRRRRKVLAVDRDGDLAAVLVATRGKRRGRRETVHRFRLEGGAWGWWGSSGRDSDDPRLPDRSTVAPGAVGAARWSASRGASGTVGHLVLHAAPAVATLRWRDQDRPVAPTGYAVVVWRGPRAPTVSAFDADGQLVGELEGGDPWPRSDRPWHIRLRVAWLSRRHRGQWITYAPRR